MVSSLYRNTLSVDTHNRLETAISSALTADVTAILRGELVSESTKRDTEKALTRRLVGLRSRPLYPSRRPRPQVRPAQRSFGRQRAGSGKLGTLAAGEA